MNFYILSNRDFQTEKDYADTEYLKGDHAKLGDAPRCPKCTEYYEGMEWLPPYKIALEMYTKQYGNIVLGTNNDLVVDDYFKDCYEKTDLTGLGFLGEAQVTKLICRNGVRKKQVGATPPKYYVARIKYGCAAIDHEKSGSVFEIGKEPTCDYCRLGGIERYPKIVIDESTWDGTDIFLARGIGSKITTSQRFKDWWDSCNFNNCKLIPSEEFHRDHRPEYLRK